LNRIHKDVVELVLKDILIAVPVALIVNREFSEVNPDSSISVFQIFWGTTTIALVPLRPSTILAMRDSHLPTLLIVVAHVTPEMRNEGRPDLFRGICPILMADFVYVGCSASSSTTRRSG
jgi:hypothetical protein